MTERTVAVGLKIRMAGALASMATLTKSVGQFQTELEKVDQRFSKQNIGKGMMLAGAGMAAGLGLAIMSAAQFEQAMSGVSAATHASAAQMDLFRDAAIEAGKDTVFTATEAAGAITELSKAGISTADILKGGLRGALDMAAAGSMAVGDAAELAATAMTQFKLSGEDIPHIADLLAAGAGKAQGSMADLGAALSQGGLVAANMGLTLEETVGTLAAFASAGLIGSDAGTSFKTMIMRLQAPVGKAALLLDELGISAYDSTGTFVGMSNVAGQLHDKLSKMTQQQRDAALATIFGSDAVRAATVLYNQGAAGLGGWVEKVNDSGYAAETAARMTDNLIGDLDRLQGTLESAFIGSTASASDGVRSLVQVLTWLVETFANLPGPVQQTVIWVAAGTAGLLLLGGATMYATAKVTAFKASLAATSVSVGGFGGKMKSVGAFMMGPWGIAIMGAAAVLALLISDSERTKANVQELSDSFDANTGAVTGSTRAILARRAADEGLLAMGALFKVNSRTITDALMGQVDAQEKVNKAIKEMPETNDVILGEHFTNGGKIIGAFKDKYAELNKEVAQAAEKSDQLREAMGGNSAETENLSGQTQVLADDLGISSEEAQGFTDALKDLDEVMQAIINSHLGVRQAEDAMIIAQKDLAEALGDVNGNLGDQSEKSIEARAELDSFVNTALEMAQAQFEASGDVYSATEAIDRQIDFIKEQGKEAGMTQKEIDEWIQTLEAMKSEYRTRVRVDFSDMTNAETAIRNVNGLLTENKNLFYGPRGHNFGPSSYADGGWVGGNGGPRQDNQLSATSTGEFIVQAGPARQHAALLEAINSGGDFQRPTMSYAAVSGGGSGGSVRVNINLAGGSNEFTRWLRKQISVEGGGNVQVALGQRGR